MVRELMSAFHSQMRGDIVEPKHDIAERTRAKSAPPRNAGSDDFRRRCIITSFARWAACAARAPLTTQLTASKPGRGRMVIIHSLQIIALIIRTRVVGLRLDTCSACASR